MMTIVVGEKQTIIDIAVQHCGDVDRMIDIVENNTIVTVNDNTGVDIDLAYDLLPGTTLNIDEAWINNKITKELTSVASAEI